MRYLLVPLALSVLISCATADSGEPSVGADSTGILPQVSDTLRWHDSFKKLVAAISKGDKAATRSFIDFPVMNEGNEIWFLADSKLVMEMDGDKIRPFTEADYDKYFSSIFAADLRQTVGKLDTATFFKTFEASSPEIEVVPDSKSQVTATYDREKKQIFLLLNTKSETEFSVQYEFRLTDEGVIKFRQVRVAG